MKYTASKIYIHTSIFNIDFDIAQLKMKLKHSTTPSFNFSSSDVLRSPTCVVTVRKVYKYSSYMKLILTKY